MATNQILNFLFTGEQERNDGKIFPDTFENAQDLGNLTGRGRGINGTLDDIRLRPANEQSGTAIRRDVDAIDTFKFQVDRPSSLSAILNAANPNNINIRLIRDFNGNNQNDGDVANGADLLTGTGFGGADQIQFDRLESGNYFLQIAKSTSPEINRYTLTAEAKPISDARIKLDIDRLIPPGSAVPVFLQANIDGQMQQSDVFTSSSGKTSLNAAVDINKRQVPIQLSAFKIENDQNIQLDLNPTIGKRTAELTYDTLTRKVSGSLTGPEGLNIIRTIRGDDPGNAGTIIGAAVNYDTASPPGSGQAAILAANSVPIVEGTNQADQKRGNNGSGILQGNKGADQLDGRGGDDIMDGGSGKDTLLGSNGNDILIGSNGTDALNGGSGDDVLFGGLGRDSLTGGANNDTFVLAAGTGADTILDFRKGMDKLGLAGDLTFDALKIIEKNDSAIVSAGNQQLAILNGVQKNQLSAADFVQVSSTQVLEMSVPFVA